MSCELGMTPNARANSIAGSMLLGLSNTGQLALLVLYSIWCLTKKHIIHTKMQINYDESYPPLFILLPFSYLFC